MIAIRFIHDGWDVITSTWSVAAKRRDTETITVCYPWSATGTLGISTSTGTARTDLALSMPAFTERLRLALRDNHPLDLREFSA